MADSDILGVGSRVDHPAYGTGVVIKLHKLAYDVCFTTYGIKTVPKSYVEWEIVEQIEAETDISFSAAEKSLIKILKYWGDVSEEIPIGEKWQGGKLIIQPDDPNLKPKEIPIDVFFHKIVMVRDKLRVMEQRINSSKKLTDEDKANLQQYLTRIYGSLTTFNVLFKFKEHHFTGSSN